MRFSALLIASVEVWLLLGLPAYSEENRDDRWQDCRASNTCTIELDHLANLGGSPFLSTGQVVDQDHPKWSHYERSLKSFTKVQDCIPYGAANDTGVNLLEFDWNAVRLGPDTEVCLFLIAMSLGSLDRIEDWFSYYGFKTRAIIADLEKPEAYISGYRVHAFGASMGIEDFRTLRPSRLHNLTGFDTSHSFAVDISFDAKMRLTSIRAKTNNK